MSHRRDVVVSVPGCCMQFYVFEVNHGRQGIGNYQLQNGLMPDDRDETPLEATTVTAPVDIVVDIRKGSTTNATVVTTVQPSSGVEESQPIASTSASEQATADASSDNAEGNDVTGTTMTL